MFHDNIEVLETDKSPVKTITVMQVVSTIQIERPDVAASDAVDVGGGGWSSETDDGVSMGEFCAEEIYSFSDVEKSKLVVLGGDSVADISGEGELQIQVAAGGATAEDAVGESRVSLNVSI